MMNDQRSDSARGWHVRPFAPGDEVALLSLYESVFGHARPAAELHWKLLKRRQAFPTVFVAALEDDSTLVGHYGGIPFNFKILDRIVPAIQVVESMTHPRYRRQGVLTAMGQAAHTAWSGADQAYITGLPNDQWGGRKQALGYSALFPLARLRFPLRLDLALAGRLRLSKSATRFLGPPLRAASRAWAGTHRAWTAGGEYGVETVTEASAEVLDSLWHHVSATWNCSLVRDAEWVTWRYLQAEPGPYTVLLARNEREPTGYLAFRLVAGKNTHAIVGDLCTARGDTGAARALLSAAIEEMRHAGVGTVVSLAPPGSDIYQTLRGLGFLPASRATAFSFELVALQPWSDVRLLRDPADWLLTGGDFDVI